MFSRHLLRAALGVSLCLAVAAWGFGQTTTPIPCTANGSQAGCKRSTGIVLILIGVAAVAVSLYAWHHHSQKKDDKVNEASIVGCVQKANGVITLKDEKDNITYGIIADTLELKNGERVELSGNKYKDDAGHLHMDVQTLVNDYGPCTP